MKQLSTLLFTFFTTTIVFNAQAQNKTTGPASYIGFYGGVSKPIGDFGSTNYYNNSAGMASLGTSFSVTGARYIYKNWAIAGSISYADQGRPSSEALQGLSDGYNADFKAGSTTVSITERYQNLNLLLGPQYTLVYGSLNIDLGLSAGLIKSFDTPQYLVTTTSLGVSPVTTSFTQNSSTTSAFAYSGSVGVRYNLSDGFGLGLTGAYIGSSGFKVTTDGDTFTNGRLVTKQPFSVLNGTFGMYFNF
jgi:hypothetical protein